MSIKGAHERGDFAPVKRDEREYLSLLAKAIHSFFEGWTEGIAIFVELNHTRIELNLCSNNVADPELLVRLNIFHVGLASLHDFRTVGLSIKQIKDPVVHFLLLIGYLIFVQIKPFPCKSNTSLNISMARCGRNSFPSRQTTLGSSITDRVTLLIKVRLDTELEVIRICTVLIESDWEVAHTLALVLMLVLVSSQSSYFDLLYSRWRLIGRIIVVEGHRHII